MSERHVVSLHFGAERLPLAPDAVLEALFSTISYRLEPNGWATRFPTVLDRLREGRLESGAAARALEELEHIGAELRRLPVDRVVWSMQDLRKRDDSGEPVRRDAPNVFDYFVAFDGRPILTCLADALQKSRMSGDAIVLESFVRHRNVVSGLVLLLVGALVGVGGYLYFPNVILVPEHESERVAQHGPLVWPLGSVLAVVGAITTAGALYPSFRMWLRARRAVAFVVCVAAFGAVVYASWR